jgi:geranylgeranylglycerol-phosphate geranylgeranyltransferase
VLFILTFQNGFNQLGLIAPAVLGVTFVGAGGAAINDYFDRDSDAITHPERPIPSGQVSPANAMTFSALTFAVGLGVSLAINSLAFGIAALNVVLFTVYPRFLKRLSGLSSNLVMGYLGASIALFAGAAVFQTINVASLSFVGMIAGGAIALNVLKDVLTVGGDVKVGYPTVAARYGIHVAAVVGALFLILSATTSFLPFLFGVVGVAYLILVAVWASLVIYAALSLLHAPDIPHVRHRLRMFTPFYRCVPCFFDCKSPRVARPDVRRTLARRAQNSLAVLLRSKLGLSSCFCQLTGRLVYSKICVSTLR